MAKEEQAAGKLKDVYKPSLFQPSGTSVKSTLFDMDRVWRIMDGAIDTHVHPGPEAYATRMYSEREMAYQACDAGMAAMVFKCHSVPTSRSTKFIQVGLDQWAKEHGKHKTDLFGGVVLNYAVGGLNPEAVVVNARLGGKYVWLPSLDSAYHHQGMGSPGGIEVLDENDNAVPPLKEIFSLIAQTDMVLGICHQTTKERFILIDEAKKAGVKKIEIIHPTFQIYKMSIEELKMVAEKGAYIGLYCWSLAAPLFDEDLTLRTIKEVGPERLVAGTDCGMFVEDSPAEAMRRFITWMLYSGIPDETVERIVKINARELLY